MTGTRTTDASSQHARFPSLRWWLRDRDGRVVLAQAPNGAILVWLTTVVVSWTGALDGDRGDAVSRVGQGALVVWSVDELLRGASPVRRLMGAVVLPVMIWRILG